VGIDYGLLTAGVFISILPILLVYIFCQRYFVEGLSGAIKG
jgi:ABC-type glycerol-3-phosphate transport system permease component